MTSSPSDDPEQHPSPAADTRPPLDLQSVLHSLPKPAHPPMTETGDLLEASTDAAMEAPTLPETPAEAGSEPTAPLEPSDETASEPPKPVRLELPRGLRPLFVVLMLLPCLMLRERLDNDTWFLLTSGRYVLQHGIPHVEPFSLHTGFHFVMQQWLSACAFWLTYEQFGITGLDVLTIACYLLTALLIFGLCMRVSRGYFLVSFAVTLLAEAALSPFMVQRPFIFSTAILAAELFLLEGWLHTGRRRGLLALPLLSILLVNLHAAMWPMLFLLLLPYVVDAFRFRLGFLTGQGYAKLPLLLTAVAMGLAGFVNPYGTEAMLYLRTSYGYAEISNFILEMFPPNISQSLGMLVYATFFAVLCVYLLHRKGDLRLRYALLSLGTAYMTLSSLRCLPDFAVCGLFPLAYYLRDFALPPAATRPRLWVRIVLLCTVTLLALGYGYRHTELWGGAARNDYSPLQDCAAYILEEHAENVVLYADYNNGGVAEFMGLRPYIDSRADVFVRKNNHKDDVMLEFYQLQRGLLYYKTFLHKYHFTHLIVTPDDTLYTNLLHDSSYRVVFVSGRYHVFERTSCQTAHISK